jgi:DNA-binding HxlR family transcriptional regulator
MVSDRYLRQVLAVMSEEPEPFVAIHRRMDISEDYLWKVLKALLALGLVEKIEFEKPIPSGRGRGLYRTGWKKSI